MVFFLNITFPITEIAVFCFGYQFQANGCIFSVTVLFVHFLAFTIIRVQRALKKTGIKLCSTKFSHFSITTEHCLWTILRPLTYASSLHSIDQTKRHQYPLPSIHLSASLSFQVSARTHLSLKFNKTSLFPTHLMAAVKHIPWLNLSGTVLFSSRNIGCSSRTSFRGIQATEGLRRAKP